MEKTHKILELLKLRCSYCKEEKESEYFYIDRIRGRRWECKKCANERIKRYYREHPRILIPLTIQWYKQRFCKLRNNALKRNKEFNLTINELIDLLNGKKCFYCGDKFKDKNNPRTIDRFDNNIGYNKDNCYLCCWYCNKMKSNISIKDKKQLRRIKLIYDKLVSKE
jgi:hypothetical protein